MSTEQTPHACDLPWCTSEGSGEVDHYQLGTYIPGRLGIASCDMPGTGASLPSVGVGALTVDGVPAVFVHIDGRSHDAQADLTLADARLLRDQLNQAITNAEQATKGGAA